MSFFSVIKVVAIVLLVVAGVVFIIRERTLPATFTNPFRVLPGQEPSISSIGLSLYSVLWAYEGW